MTIVLLPNSHERLVATQMINRSRYYQSFGLDKLTAVSCFLSLFQDVLCRHGHILGREAEFRHHDLARR